MQAKIAIAAVENADKRLKEVDKLNFAIAAIADYDNGLTTGFKDGAEWMAKHCSHAAWFDPDVAVPAHSFRVLVEVELPNRSLLFTGGWYSQGDSLDGPEGWSHDLQRAFPDARVVRWREIYE